jgi:hypothetical protein
MMMTKKDHPLSPEVFKNRRGTDPVLDLMLDLQIPLTRAAYLVVAGLEEPLGAELEAMLPDEFGKSKM